MKKLLSTLAVVILLLLGACTGDVAGGHITTDNPDEAIHTITFTKEVQLDLFFIDDDDYNVEESLGYLESFGSGHYTDISVVDNESVSMTLTDSELTWWLDLCRQTIKENEDKLKSYSSNFSVDIDEAYATVQFFMDPTLSWIESAPILVTIGGWCQMYQVLSGTIQPELHEFIYNSDTGKLMAGDTTGEGRFSYEWSDWTASYVLDSDEAAALTAPHPNAIDLAVRALLISDLTEIDFLKTETNNNFSYVYEDEVGYVHVGIDEAEKGRYREAFLESLENLVYSFKDEGSSLDYKLSYAEDFSGIDVYFDESLSDEDAGDYIGKAALLCALMQMLDDGSSTYSLDIQIYNSETSELIARGNTQDGIQWDMGA